MNRKLALIAGGVVVALLGAWYLILWKPAGKNIALARQEQATAQDAETGAQQAQATLVIKRRLLPASKAEAALLTGAAPLAADIPGMIDQVTADATATGVVITSESHTGPVTPTATTGVATSIESSSLTLSATGSYDQVLTFVARLQSTPRLVKISSLSLLAAASTGTTPSGAGAVGSGGAPGSVALTTSLTATFFNDSAALPAAPSSK